MAELPLVLCGPMVRKATRNAVHIFLALSRPVRVRLEVWQDVQDQPGRLLMTGEATPHTLGPGLHVVMVTARRPADVEVTWGTRCDYDLTFDLPEGPRRLLDPGVLTVGPPTTADRLTYGSRTLPGFQLASSRADRLRIFHGSCRKPHGDGHDALLLLDDALEAAWRGHGHMPQYLFLTGDQIYADDVHPALLRGLEVLQSRLLGNEERDLLRAHYPDALEVGHRRKLVAAAGFTTDEGESHLATLGEFLGMYCLTWSPALWAAAGINHAALRSFRAGLGRIRRALAHVSTGMMFDDHDVTDDWNIRRSWVDRVAAGSLGRRLVRNALAAYAVFQHWGNAPEAFAPGQPGASVLDSLVHRGAFGAPEALDHVLGALPTQDQQLPWSWAWKDNRSLVHIIALDCRTRRSFEGARPFALVSSVDIDRLLDRPPDENPAFSIVISPAPVLGSTVFDWLQKQAGRFVGLPKADYEPWSASNSFDMLINHLFHRAPAVVLSGDVHFAYVAAAEAQAGVHRGRRIVNCTASSLKNQCSAVAATVVAAAEKLFGASALAPFATVENLLPQLDAGHVATALVVPSNIGDVTLVGGKLRHVLWSRDFRTTTEVAFPLAT